MYNYAILDQNNICVGISQLTGPVDRPNLVAVSNEELKGVMGKRLADGAWVEAPQPEPQDLPDVTGFIMGLMEGYDNGTK